MRHRRSAVLVGVLSLCVAIVYWAEPAGSVPHFFPGYRAGSEHRRLALGSFAITLALIAFVVSGFMEVEHARRAR